MRCRVTCKSRRDSSGLPSSDSPSSFLFILVRRMASLAPPPANRHRASSTSLRPPLTLSSLGRRRSNSDLPPCHTPSPVSTPTMLKDVPNLSLDIPANAPTHKLLAKATFIELYSRFMDLIHAANKESPYSSTPSSPRMSRVSTSTEDSILPITSPTVGTFSEAYAEKPTVKSASWWQGAPSVRTRCSLVVLSCVDFFLVCRFTHLYSLSSLCSRCPPLSCCSACRLSRSLPPGREISRTLRSSGVSYTAIRRAALPLWPTLLVCFLLWFLGITPGRYQEVCSGYVFLPLNEALRELTND